jgi:hypothetical protein
MNTWQIAAGEPGRDYSGLCIKHDLVMIGPGDPGEYSTERYAKERMAPQIRQFCEDPTPGDLVLLRLGHRVVAVGAIPAGEDAKVLWLSGFEAVLGWDLQHVRRVMWGDEKVLHFLQDMQPVFSNYKQQRTIHKVKEDRILSRVDQMKAAIRSRPLRPLPQIGDRLDDASLGIALFRAGLANETVEGVIKAIRKIRRLATWYEEAHCPDRPNEHEIVTHAVAPLLLGLGWSEQLLGIEWRKIDVAIFDRLPATPQHCIAVCEAKKLGVSLSAAYQQAQSYIQRQQLLSCRLIITTDGKSLYTYRRSEREWPGEPTGYINLCKIRASYAMPERTSSVDTLVGLLPARIHQESS